MWLLISSFAILYLSCIDNVSGFPRVLEMRNPGRHKRDNSFAFDTDTVLWRERRGDNSNKVHETGWNEKQETNQKLMQIKELEGESVSEEEGYNSYKQKWVASWTNGPIERRLHSLNIGPRNRFGFPLSLPLPGRSKPHNTGYYKELDVAGRTE
ncbi:unnamed protein product [Allacma fusca]|uniref:Uncharacterized protein n=1 Tax=Allacma fusca TaxID=39272 RepID=A0A8J2P9Q7_9HEXA|nr:unnamed protein product [Allacma fusca]